MLQNTSGNLIKITIKYAGFVFMVTVTTKIPANVQKTSIKNNEEDNNQYMICKVIKSERFYGKSLNPSGIKYR